MSFDCEIPAAIKSLPGLKFSAKILFKCQRETGGESFFDGKLKLDGLISSKAVEAALPAGKLAIGATSIKLNGEPDTLEVSGKK